MSYPSYIIVCHPSKTTWHADSMAQVFVFASLRRTPRLPVSSCVPRKRLLHGRGTCLTRSTTSPREPRPCVTPRCGQQRAHARTCVRTPVLLGKGASGRHHDRGPQAETSTSYDHAFDKSLTVLHQRSARDSWSNFRSKPAPDLTQERHRFAGENAPGIASAACANRTRSAR
jgi:hypothetical protein